MQVALDYSRDNRYNIPKKLLLLHSDNQNDKMSTFSFEYQRMPVAELSEPDRELCRRATIATGGSYAPYSNYNVGAALRLADGTVMAGANQENASYPCGTCAERTALNYAQANYPQMAVEAIAVAAAHKQHRGDATSTHRPPYPCGLCRQTLAETEHRQQTPIKVLLVDGDEAIVIPSASCLLPFTFE